VVVVGGGVTVVTVVCPLLPVTVIVVGGGGGAGEPVPGSSPGFVTRVVVVVGVLPLSVSLMARPPTATAASAAAIPKSSAGRRYHGSSGTATVEPCTSVSTCTGGATPVAA
jgi:hypothetical protein